MPGGGRPLRNQNYTLAGPIQVGSGTYDAAGNAPSVNVSWAWNVNSSWGSYVCPHGTKTLTGSPIGPDIQKPSSLGCTVNSVTWNSVNGTFSVGNWGNEPTGSSKYIAGRLFGESGSARREETGTNTNSITKTITTSSTPLDGGITVKGAGNYRIDTYASNSAGSSTTSMQNVYTPPAPLASLTYTQTEGSTNVSVSATITGADSGSNYGNTVTTYYRYSTNGGSSYSNWTSAGTGTAWTAKTVSFTVPYGSSVKIQAKQTYQSKDSTVKEVSFTASTGTAPSGLMSAITASTWNSVTMNGSCSYGMPSSVSGRSLTVGANINGTGLANRREVNTQNVTSVSGVVIDNSSSNLGGAFDLKGMLAVYPYVWASNTVQSASSIGQVYYLPPAPGQFSYELAYETAASKSYNVYFAGVPANNTSDYLSADLSMTMEMWDDVADDWAIVDTMSGVQIDSSRLYWPISLAPQTSARFRGKLTYKNKDSEYVYLTITTSDDPVLLYGSVNNATKAIEHFYGSVNSETVKVIRIYGSEDGVARKVFEDV